MYDPTIGRWLTEDPIGFEAADPNLYRYVGNNATNKIDPSGLVDLDNRIISVQHDLNTTQGLRALATTSLQVSSAQLTTANRRLNSLAPKIAAAARNLRSVRAKLVSIDRALFDLGPLMPENIGKYRSLRAAHDRLIEERQVLFRQQEQLERSRRAAAMDRAAAVGSVAIYQQLLSGHSLRIQSLQEELTRLLAAKRAAAKK